MENKLLVNRRDFIKRSSAILSTAMIMYPGLTQAMAPRYKMGLQLYTIRDAMAANLQGTLKRVADIGYEDLETYGYDSNDKKYYGLAASDFKKLLEDNQLTTSSGHYDLFNYVNKSDDELKQYVDRCIEGAQAIGQQYITWPWLKPEDRTLEKFRLLSNKLNMIGEQVARAGLGFAYHNHDFEFIDHNGENGYNIIMQQTDSNLVKLQIDLYWVMHSSKLSPAELFSKNPGRFVMWHIKDMHKVSRDYTELGNGSIDYGVIVPSAGFSGLQYYFIEQGGNFKVNSMESIAESAEYFKKHLAKHL